MPPHRQDDAYNAAQKDPSKFWTHQAQQISWHKSPQTAYKRVTKKLSSGVEHESWQWFPDGELSTSYNCVTRHVDAGNGDKTAISKPIGGQKQPQLVETLPCY